MTVILGIDPESTGTKKLLVKISGKEANIIKSGKVDKSICVLASNYLTFRKFNLPIKDRKKINEIIKEDLSQTLLFYNDAVWDFTFGPDNEIFVAITTKNAVQKTIKHAGLKPHVIEAEPYALVRAASFAGYSEGLIIYFDTDKTVFAGFKNNLLNFCKVLLKSASNLINEIAVKNNISEAQTRQIINSEGLQNKQIFEFYRSMLETAFPEPVKQNYPSIIIMGSSAEIPRMAEFLKTYFGVPANIMPAQDKTGDIPNLTAYGAALKQISKEHGVNLAPYKIEEKSARFKWIILALLPLLLLLVDVKYKETVLSARQAQINQKMVEMLKRDFPLSVSKTKKIQYPLNQYKSLLSRYSGDTFAGGGNVLDILAGVSSGLSSAVKIDSIDLSETAGVELGGKSDSIKNVEDFKQSLSAKFKNVELQEVKNLPKGVKFKIIMKAQ